MEEILNWNCELEVNLFHALRGHKPVGVNRHFHMLSIHEKLSKSNKKITTKQIWAYLSELYNLNALNESEILPFPNREEEFSLPDEGYAELVEKNFPRTVLTKTDTDKPDKHDHTDRHDRAELSSSKALKCEGRHSVGTPVINTPDNSPKRKRTRQTPSTASPATPDAPPHKRRR